MSTIRYKGKVERVILGHFMYPKETREVPEALAVQLAKDNPDIEIVGQKKADKKKEPRGWESQERDQILFRARHSTPKQRLEALEEMLRLFKDKR